MKTLFFLLITLFFATIGFAEVSHQTDESNKKIEKIEEKLDTTKEELTKYTQITDDTKERVGDISSSVDRFTTALSIFGTLVTIVLIFVAWSSRNSAIQEARITAQDEAQKLFDKWVKEKAKDFAEKEIHFEKIMNDKIKLFEDNVDVKTVQIMFENAVGYGRNKQYTEALKIYDEIIRSYAKSQNEIILVKFAMAVNNRGVLLFAVGKGDEAIESSNELISMYQDSNIYELVQQVVIAVLNKLEFEIILDKLISNDYKLIEELDKAPRNLAIIKMLLIIKNAISTEQDSELQLWLEKYDNIKNDIWSFDELEKWIDKAIYAEDVKTRIQSYISIFKTHLHRA